MFSIDFSLKIVLLYDITKSKHMLNSFSKPFPQGLLLFPVNSSTYKIASRS